MQEAAVSKMPQSFPTFSLRYLIIKNDNGEECGCLMTVELSVSELIMLSIIS